MKIMIVSGSHRQGNLTRIAICCEDLVHIDPTVVLDIFSLSKSFYNFGMKVLGKKPVPSHLYGSQFVIACESNALFL